MKQSIGRITTSDAYWAPRIGRTSSSLMERRAKTPKARMGELGVRPEITGEWCYGSRDRRSAQVPISFDDRRRPQRLPIHPKRAEVLGIPVDCVDMDGAVLYIKELLNESRAHTVLAVNPEKVMRALEDPVLLHELRAADVLIPDGIGVVAAVRLLGLGRLGRVPGSDLMPRLCEMAADNQIGIYLLGAQEAVNERAAQTLLRRYPGLRIAGRHHGYVGDEDMATIVEEINQSGAKILFVALGSPRQEIWMGRFREQLKVQICQGVGGTFDVIAGNVKRAPDRWISFNLEWLYRLLSQPKRLIRQSALPRFVARVVVAKARSWAGVLYNRSAFPRDRSNAAGRT